MFEIATAVIIAPAFNLSIRLVVPEVQVIESHVKKCWCFRYLSFSSTCLQSPSWPRAWWWAVPRLFACPHPILALFLVQFVEDTLSCPTVTLSQSVTCKDKAWLYHLLKTWNFDKFFSCNIRIQLKCKGICSVFCWEEPVFKFERLFMMLVCWSP